MRAVVGILLVRWSPGVVQCQALRESGACLFPLRCAFIRNPLVSSLTWCTKQRRARASHRLTGESGSVNVPEGGQHRLCCCAGVPCHLVMDTSFLPRAGLTATHVQVVASVAEGARAAGRQSHHRDRQAAGKARAASNTALDSQSVEELLGLSALTGKKERVSLRGDAAAVNIGLPAGWTQLTDPVTHRSYFYNEDAKVTTWDIPQPDTLDALTACEDKDIGSSYTHCDPAVSARELTFFFKRQCKNGVPLPPAVTGLPCNITCNPGQYLPLGREACASCEPGTYSIGGGRKYMSWETFPEGSETRCNFQLEADRDTPCTGWVLNGSYMHSGDMKGYRLVDSIMEMKVELLRAGSVAFEYRVDAERRWDGLYFVVDGENAMQLESYQFQYKSFVWPLSAGFHTLQWIYHKDVAYEMGEDKAFIRTIQVIGTDFNSEKCTPCPKGYYSNPGSSECNPCAVNTYADTAASATCKPCNTGADQSKYALPGATSCLPAKPCTKDDIVTSYSDCGADGKKRTRRQSYSQPKICNGGVAPLPDAEVDCAPCEAGMYRQGSECLYCPAGSYNPTPTHDGASVCTKCPKGSVAKKVRYFDASFGQIMFQKYLDRGEMSTGCANGFCGSGGWRAMGDKLDTGVGNGQVADVWLSLKVSMETYGEVSFNYSTRVTNSEDNLQMYVNDERVWGVETQQMYAYEYRYDEMYDADTPHAQGDDPEVLEYILELPPGEHVLTWVFHKEREYSWMSDSVDVTKPKEDRAVIEVGEPPPASTCLHIPPPASTYLHLPPHTFTCLHIPQPASTYLHLPPHASTYLHLPPPAFACLHLPSPTFTCPNLPSPASTYPPPPTCS